MNIKPLQRGAGLAIVDERAPEQPFRDPLRIRIGQHDAGIIAAEFERQALQRAGGILHDPAAGRGRAGERHLRDAGMRGHQAADLVRAGDDIDNARRELLVDELDKADGRERRQRRRLDDDRVASAYRRNDVPACDHHRPIPWGDRAHNADRLAMQLDTAVRIILQDLDRKRQFAGVYGSMPIAPPISKRDPRPLSGLPCSKVSSLASSSACASSVCAIARQASARSASATSFQTANAREAASTACVEISAPWPAASHRQHPRSRD